jgi:hypothetical protein
LAATALVSLLTAAVILTRLVTEVFVALGLVAVTIAIRLIPVLLSALIRLISLAALTLSAICICQWTLPCGLLPLSSLRDDHHPR